MSGFKVNLRAALVALEATTGEAVESVVLSDGIVLSAAEGLANLDRDQDWSEVGALYAWTPSRVYFIKYDNEYNDFELGWVPRNPAAISPSLSGEEIAFDFFKYEWRGTEKSKQVPNYQYLIAAIKASHTLDAKGRAEALAALAALDGETL